MTPLGHEVQQTSVSLCLSSPSQAFSRGLERVFSLRPPSRVRNILLVLNPTVSGVLAASGGDLMAACSGVRQICCLVLTLPVTSHITSMVIIHEIEIKRRSCFMGWLKGPGLPGKRHIHKLPYSFSPLTHERALNTHWDRHTGNSWKWEEAVSWQMASSQRDKHGFRWGLPGSQHTPFLTVSQEGSGWGWGLTSTGPDKVRKGTVEGFLGRGSIDMDGLHGSFSGLPSVSSSARNKTSATWAQFSAWQIEGTSWGQERPGLYPLGIGPIRIYYSQLLI